MNEAIKRELEDPDTLMLVRLPLSVKRLAAICATYQRGEAVIKAMPRGCEWMVVKKGGGE